MLVGPALQGCPCDTADRPGDDRGGHVAVRSDEIETGQRHHAGWLGQHEQLRYHFPPAAGAADGTHWVASSLCHRVTHFRTSVHHIQHSYPNSNLSETIIHLLLYHDMFFRI